MKRGRKEIIQNQTPKADTVKEIEEGEIVEKWEDVTPGQSSRSPTLKFGQVKLLTPS